jgi:uncharacterized membrane protein (DUF2068 family)
VTRTDPPRSRRIIRLIALERMVRGVALLAAGVYLVTHSHSDLGRLANRVAQRVELDPRRPFVHHLIERLHHLHASTVLITGVLALGYGGLELVEGVGLWRDKLWAEFLTVIATSLLVPFEVYELVHKPTLLKAAGIAVNIAIVVYLGYRLRMRLKDEAARADP